MAADLAEVLGIEPTWAKSLAALGISVQDRSLTNLQLEYPIQTKIKLIEKWPEAHLRIATIERFWRLVAISPGKCWRFGGYLTIPKHGTGYGYGLFRIQTERINKNGHPTGRLVWKTVRAHKFAWESVNGPVPPGMVLRHKPKCFRDCCCPFHLTPGTHQENMDDMVAAGTGRNQHTRHEPLNW